MICPHCLKHIDDDAMFCPYCNGFGDRGAAHASAPVFCEGCGARISPHDRVCPKCGRPAPAILSADASAGDLAAGKTASFPALSSNAVSTRDRVQTESLDPDLTNNLYLGSSIDSAPVQDVTEDPYHPKRRRTGKVAAALAAIALVLAAGLFVYFDPLDVMPGLESSFKQAASDAFPSREPAEGEASDAAGEAVDADAPLTDDAAYARLDAAYAKLVAYHESFGDVIDDFNGYYAAYDKSLRDEASSSAYGMRDGIDAVVEELSGLNFEEGSPRKAEADALIALAEQLRVRPQALCDCWDVSLAYGEGETPDGDEVLASLRASYNDGSWYDSWDAFEEGIEAAAPAKN